VETVFLLGLLADRDGIPVVEPKRVGHPNALGCEESPHLVQGGVAGGLHHDLGNGPRVVRIGVNVPLLEGREDDLSPPQSLPVPGVGVAVLLHQVRHRLAKDEGLGELLRADGDRRPRLSHCSQRDAEAQNQQNRSPDPNPNPTPTPTQWSVVSVERCRSSWTSACPLNRRWVKAGAV